MKKSISISSIATAMSNLYGRTFGQWFSSKELTDILQDLGVKGKRQAIEDLENHGIIEFKNARVCRFTVSREWLVEANLVKVIG